jgi:predicted ATP-grasp superfamily ATP-dependent carboligase
MPEAEMIRQPFVSGRNASVSFLVGTERLVPLCPVLQRLSSDGRFHYLGGELPLPANLAQRATALGRQAVKSVPGLSGYIGVDLVLGAAANGSEDHVIEMNPRLTTSYIGLRRLARENIAHAILNVTLGLPQPEVTWHDGPLSFTADGQVSELEA